jgi:hypothetical protein
MRWGWTHRYAVPLFVASVVAVLLTGGGLAWVLVAGNDDGGNPNGGGDIDACLLGSWRVVSHTEDMEALGTQVRLQLPEGGQGPVVEFRSDGTGRADYGTGTQYVATALGQPLPATVSGTITFRYRAADGTFQITEPPQSEATFSVESAGLQSVYQLDTVAESYTCAGDELTFTRPERNYTGRYQRLG